MQKKRGEKGIKQESDSILSAQKRTDMVQINHLISEKAQACTRGSQPETSPSCPAVTRGGDVTLLADTTLLTNRSLIQTERSVKDITALLSQQT